jgi:hypothetical protein
LADLLTQLIAGTFALAGLAAGRLWIVGRLRRARGLL